MAETIILCYKSDSFNFANLSPYQNCSHTYDKLLIVILNYDVNCANVQYQQVTNIISEKQMFFVDFTLESKTYWVFAVFNWVLVRFIKGNRIFFRLYFLCDINYLNWVFSNSFALLYH